MTQVNASTPGSSGQQQNLIVAAQKNVAYAAPAATPLSRTEVIALGCDFVRPVRFTKDGRLPSHRLRTFFFFGSKLVFAQKLVLLRIHQYTTK